LVYGGSSDDVIRTGGGRDRIFAAEGNNTIDAGSGDDVIYSGSGNDTIDAGVGNDTIWLGGGRDTIALARGNGTDTIHNFQAGRTSFNLLGGLGLADLSYKRVDGSTIVQVGNETLAKLVNTQLG
jgi:Ca2+-binding RTX toxin-like protein